MSNTWYWKPRKIWVKTDRGEIEVSSWVYQGLAVHETTKSSRTVTLTHVESGRSLGDFETRIQAKRAAVRLHSMRLNLSTKAGQHQMQEFLNMQRGYIP
jgi:hypothetical protein